MVRAWDGETERLDAYRPSVKFRTKDICCHVQTFNNGAVSPGKSAVHVSTRLMQDIIIRYGDVKSKDKLNMKSCFLCQGRSGILVMHFSYVYLATRRRTPFKGRFLLPLGTSRLQHWCD